MMKRIRVLEKVKAFPHDGYRFLASYSRVLFISVEQHNGTEYFCLHLEGGLSATYNTVDYIMEFM